MISIFLNVNLNVLLSIEEYMPFQSTINYRILNSCVFLKELKGEYYYVKM